MQHLPIFLTVRGRACLLVGGGEVAARKAALLLRAGARIAVVAPALGEEMAAHVAAGRLAHRAERFTPEQLDGAALAIAATDERAVNARVSRHARLRGVPVNVVDDPSLCSFIMPAIVDRAPVMVAVSTGGAAPALARAIRARIEAALPASVGWLAALSGAARARVAGLLPDGLRRRRFWDSAFAGRIAELAAAGRHGDAEAAFESDLAAAVRGEAPPGEVHLVGAGPGDPELLTLRAVRLLQTADVIVHDKLVAPAILDYARRDATRIDAGKRAGRASMAQDDINALLIRLARQGKRVVRLKGGDPFIFGRGGEEMLALAAAGIAVQVVPGITAANGCGAVAGIPLTHRAVAQSCVFVTGHGTDGLPELDWAALARANQTVVVYMGVRHLGEIAARLIAHGRGRATPAALVENGTLPNQHVVAGTLADLPARAAAARVTGPALLIVGEVVALAPAAADAPDAVALAV